jgi:hypothetical protein
VCCLLFYGPVYALTLDASVEVCYQETHMATYRPGHHHQVSLGAPVRTNDGGHSRKQYVSLFSFSEEGMILTFAAVSWKARKGVLSDYSLNASI